MKVTLSVGEPWVFTSPDGSNVLHGTINREDYGCDDTGDWAIMQCTPFEIGDILVTNLLIHDRYHKQFINDLLTGKTIMVNAAWHARGEWTPSLLDELHSRKTTRDDVAGWLIGNITRI